MNTMRRRIEALEGRATIDTGAGACLVVFDDAPVPDNPERRQVIRVRFVESDGRGGVRNAGPTS